MLKHLLATAVIKHYEGFYAEPYNCPAGIKTIGFGRTSGNLTDKTTEDAETIWLNQRVLLIDDTINALVKPHLSRYQMAALISFIYNVGPNAFANSTLLELINKQDLNASAQFLRWTKAADVRLTGLAKRRTTEFLMYECGIFKLL